MGYIGFRVFRGGQLGGASEATVLEDAVAVVRLVVLDGKLRAQSENWTLAGTLARPRLFWQ